MSSVPAVATWSPELRWRRFAWRHPEWWPLAICAAAWLWMMRGHAHHAPAMANWLAMTLAMMLPIVARTIRLTAERSLWPRRHRAMAAFLAGYLSCWLVAGLAMAWIPAQRWAGAAAFAIAAAWQLTRWKRRALGACHRTMPLAPRGWRADRDCIVFGWTIGASCVVSCWVVMLACVLSGHALLATAAATAIGIVERYAIRPDRRLLAAALLGIAVMTFAGG